MGDNRKRVARQEQQRAVTGEDSGHRSFGVPRGFVSQTEVVWQGPLPPPDVLHGYNFIPDGPNRLMAMAEKEQAHRHSQDERRSRTETRISRSEAFQRVWGAISATLIGLAGVGGGTYLISVDKPLYGLAALVGTLATLVLAVQGAKKQPSKPNADPSQRELPLR